MSATIHLGEVIKLRKGKKAVETHDGKVNGSKPYIQIDEVRGVRPVKFASDPRGVEVTADDLCIVWDGANAGTVGYGVEGLIGSTVARMRLLQPDEWDTRFIGRLLQSRFQELNDQAQSRGATIPHVDKAKLETIELPRISKGEQRRIAAILGKADGIRRKREQALNMTDRLLQSAFLEMFGDPVSNPKGWPVVKLGDCAEEVRYGTSVKCTDDSSHGLPVLRIPNVVGGEVIWDDLKFASLSKKEIGRLRMRSGDIIFVRTNGNPEYIARCAVFDAEEEALFASYLIRARLSAQSKLTPRYVWMALSMPSYRRVLLRETKTTAGNYNISGSGLKSLKIPAPPLSDQQEFERFYRRLSSGIANMAESLAGAENLLGSLSQRAFRGEL